MSNSFFQFKKFRVEQGQCAMKVCTDSCIFGAYISVGKEANKILDIGTGTGLLALMLAQKSPDVEIDAVEMEPSAAEQAKDNFYESQWKNRLTVYKKRIQEFTSPYQYDLIVSNPPFFSNSLESPDKKINIAHHGTSLPIDELLGSILNLLKTEGKLWILLPPYESELFIKRAERLSLHLNEKLNIRDRPDSEIIRTILHFSFKKNDCAENNFTVKDEKGKYSTGFIKLLRDYYLHLD
jgi:tRNA1Val (adenine37-N6)-methyltransferase